MGCGQSGRLILTSNDPIDQGITVIQRLVEHTPLRPGSSLGSAFLLQCDENGIIASRSEVPTNTLQNAMKTLSGLGHGARAWFVFAERYKDEQPMLFVHTERKVLKTAYTHARQRGVSSLTGQVRRKKDGVFIFSARRDYPGFVSTLVAWLRTQRIWHPEIETLRGSQFVVLNESGGILRKERNDVAWNTLFEETAR